MTSQGNSGKDLFLSHSHADKGFVRRLAGDCEQQGITVWVDEAEVLVGDSLIAKIEDAIDKSRFFAVVVSANSVESQWVQKELEQAIELELSSDSVKVLPIVLGQVENLPGFLRSKLYADFSNWPHDPGQYESSLKLLVRSVTERKLRTAELDLKNLVPEDIVIQASRGQADTIDEANVVANNIVSFEQMAGIESELETYYRMGNLFAAQKDFVRAIELYDRVIEIAPTHFKAWYNKGYSLESLKRYDEAFRCYSRGDEVSPHGGRPLALSLWNMACTYRALGEHRKALELIDRAIAADPLVDGPYYMAGEIYEELGQPDKALEYIERCLAAASECGQMDMVKKATAKRKALNDKRENSV